MTHENELIAYIARNNLKIYDPKEDIKNSLQYSKKKCNEIIFSHRWKSAPANPYDFDRSFRCPCGAMIDICTDGKTSYYYSNKNEGLTCSVNWDIKDIIE